MPAEGYCRLDNRKLTFYSTLCWSPTFHSTVPQSQTDFLQYSSQKVANRLTEERNLAADEEDEEGDRRPEHLLAELDLPLGAGHLGHEAAQGLHEAQQLDCNGEGYGIGTVGHGESTVG